MFSDMILPFVSTYQKQTSSLNTQRGIQSIDFLNENSRSIYGGI